ncbi:hypothetical protein [Caballeronia sp. GAFFF2]|uniref:hypothetical protein n=1 Tax=Caballeronia sp. GAFFF2 TaxID=2921741 RepID=UPI0020292156|nr:hypothetical protein [Caballeronia sp. GAFFF2]
MRRARREFLTGASLAAAYAWAIESIGDTKAARMRLLVVCDERCSDSRAFAHRASLNGARVVAWRNDAGLLWHERLLPDASLGVPLAGLTTYADAFVLSRLAWTCGLRMTKLACNAEALVAWRMERLKQSSVD